MKVGSSGGRRSKTKTVIRTAKTASENALNRSGVAARSTAVFFVGAGRCTPQSLQNLAPAGFSCSQDGQLTGCLPILASSACKSPRWTPENRPVVDGAKPASGRAAPSTSVLPQSIMIEQAPRLASAGPTRGYRDRAPTRIGPSCAKARLKAQRGSRPERNLSP